jgi:hypothetical protein
MKALGAGGWLVAALLAGAAPARAQVVAPADSVPVAAPTPAPAPDSLRPPATPMGAMFRSFLLPGWGQAIYGRKVTAGVMIGFEGLAVGMALKSQAELDYIERTGSGRADAKRQERQDWLALVVFNHLMSGLEAYVSSHLWDFPGDLELRALPGGAMGATLSLPLRGGGPR